MCKGARLQEMAKVPAGTGLCDREQAENAAQPSPSQRSCEERGGKAGTTDR